MDAPPRSARRSAASRSPSSARSRPRRPTRSATCSPAARLGAIGGSEPRPAAARRCWPRDCSKAGASSSPTRSAARAVPQHGAGRRPDPGHRAAAAVLMLGEPGLRCRHTAWPSGAVARRSARRAVCRGTRRALRAALGPAGRRHPARVLVGRAGLSSGPAPAGSRSCSSCSSASSRAWACSIRCSPPAFRLAHTESGRVARTLATWAITSSLTVAALTAVWGLLAVAIVAAIAAAGALLLAARSCCDPARHDSGRDQCLRRRPAGRRHRRRRRGRRCSRGRLGRLLLLLRGLSAGCPSPR